MSERKIVRPSQYENNKHRQMASMVTSVENNRVQ